MILVGIGLIVFGVVRLRRRRPVVPLAWQGPFSVGDPYVGTAAPWGATGSGPPTAAWAPPARWYGDPMAPPGAAQLRYWDGSQWTAEAADPS
ncbi:MAG: DUF2510 domain-containing protein [Acidimicrobiales bacterium]|jgi:uncharacterized protein DUF2510